MKANNIFTLIIAGCVAGMFAASCDKTTVNEEAAEPTITTVSLRNVTYTSAECVGRVTGDVDERGVCWSTNPGPAVSDNKLQVGAGAGEFTATIDGLSEGTVYYVRAYAKRSTGYIYGEQQRFRTYNVGEPIVHLLRIDDIGTHKARFTATLMADGGTDITELGVCYAFEPEPTVPGMKVMAESRTPGNYFLSVTDLLDAQKYHARAYAVTADGTYYSNAELEFTTIEDFPVCSVPVFSEPSDTSVKVTVEATQTANRLITSWGFCWSISSETPTTADNRVELGTTSGGAASATVDNLAPGTTIHVRTYAITDASTTYSDAASGSTTRIMPAVETGVVNATTIFKYSAIVTGSKIIDLGERNLPILKAGVCYSWTNPTPTIADEVAEQSKLEVAMMDDVTVKIIPPGTKIYARAFASNEMATGYGEVIEFTTAPENLFITEDASSTSPTAPNYNGVRAYYLPMADGGTADRTSNMSEWQLGKYAELQTAFNNYGSRKFDYMSFMFTSNKATDGIAPTAGTEKYVVPRIHYRNSAGSGYTGAFNMKYSIDERGLFSFSSPDFPTTGTAYGNFNGFYNNSAEIKACVDEFIAYLQSYKFMMELETLDGLGYLFIPVEEPTNYYKFTYVRYSGVAYLPAW